MIDRSAPFLSPWRCVALASVAGLMGLSLMRLVPIAADNDYVRRYSAWAREVNELFAACGKHEPRDSECVRRHPIREKP